jgi:hypothetical protein
MTAMPKFRLELSCWEVNTKVTEKPMKKDGYFKDL